MAETTTQKIVLLNPTDFVRHVSDVILLNQKAERETTSTLPSIVSRAKSIANRTGFMLADFKRTS